MRPTSQRNIQQTHHTWDVSSWSSPLLRTEVERARRLQLWATLQRCRTNGQSRTRRSGSEQTTAWRQHLSGSLTQFKIMLSGRFTARSSSPVKDLG